MELTKSQNFEQRLQESADHRIVLVTPFFTKNIVSYGLIVYSQQTKRWALVRRKYTNEFLTFIKGLYRPSYLPLLLMAITPGEKTLITQCLADSSDRADTFRNLYLVDMGHNADSLPYAILRFNESRSIIQRLISKYDFSNNTLTWGWPVGRMIYHNKETPFESAKRVFQDEMEITLPYPVFITDTYISENAKDTAHRTTESRYYIYIIDDEIPLNPYVNNTEICDRIWCTTDECRTKLHNTSLFDRIVNII